MHIGRNLQNCSIMEKHMTIDQMEHLANGSHLSVDDTDRIAQAVRICWRLATREDAERLAVVMAGVPARQWSAYLHRYHDVTIKGADASKLEQARLEALAPFVSSIYEMVAEAIAREDDMTTTSLV